MGGDGKRRLLFGQEMGQRVWVPLEDLPNHFRSDVNQNQIDQLGAEEKQAFLAKAQDSMRMFGYL
jgi:hypothetical protein